MEQVVPAGWTLTILSETVFMLSIYLSLFLATLDISFQAGTPLHFLHSPQKESKKKACNSFEKEMGHFHAPYKRNKDLN